MERGQPKAGCAGWVEAVRDGTSGELINGSSHCLNPNKVGFSCCDTDVGILAEHRVDGDEVPIQIIMAEGVETVSSVG